MLTKGIVLEALVVMTAIAVMAIADLQLSNVLLDVNQVPELADL